MYFFCMTISLPAEQYSMKRLCELIILALTMANEYPEENATAPVPTSNPKGTLYDNLAGNGTTPNPNLILTGSWYGPSNQTFTKLVPLLELAGILGKKGI